MLVTAPTFGVIPTDATPPRTWTPKPFFEGVFPLMGHESRAIASRVPNKVHTWLQQRARAEERTISWVVKKLLERAIADQSIGGSRL
jgi:hypothetical protein